MTALVALPLASSDAPLAFPLAREMLPDLDLAGWRAFAARLSADEVEGKGGILCVRNEAGYLCGLCVYRVESGEKRRLVVEHLVALGMLNETSIADALARGVEKVAVQNGCVAIHTRINAVEERLLNRLAAAGHEPKLVLTCKPLSCPTATRCGARACIGVGAGEAAT